MKLEEWRPKDWKELDPLAEEAINIFLLRLAKLAERVQYKKYHWSLESVFSLGEVLLHKGDMDGYVAGWCAFLPDVECMLGMKQTDEDEQRVKEVAAARAVLKKHGIEEA